MQKVQKVLPDFPKYANYHFYSDIYPYEIIEKVPFVLKEEVYDDDCYSKGSVWQHKDGGVYEIIEKVPFVLKEEVDEEISISRNRHLIWYRVRFADKLNDEVYVRTQEHFDSSFTWIPNSNLM